jgi:hypothetical protein
MSERGDIWLFRGFSVTCILSAFVGALTVGMLLGEPDVLMLFGAVGGVMVGAVLYVVNHRRYPPSVWPPMKLGRVASWHEPRWPRATGRRFRIDLDALDAESLRLLRELDQEKQAAMNGAWLMPRHRLQDEDVAQRSNQSYTCTSA